jgi:hypothetical protein
MIVASLNIANLVLSELLAIGWVYGMELEFSKAKFIDNEEFTPFVQSIRNLQYENPYNL